MEFYYKGKEYNVFKVEGRWRVYSTDPNFTKEEGIEVIKELEEIDKKNGSHSKEEK